MGFATVGIRTRATTSLQLSRGFFPLGKKALAKLMVTQQREAEMHQQLLLASLQQEKAHC